MSRACLVDLTLCMGCRGCQVACKQWNQLPAEKTTFFAGKGGYQNPPNLSADSFTLVGYTEIEVGGDLKWVFSKHQCMHCVEPSCVSACPVKALEINENGAVVYHGDKCMGCRYCMMACPFGVPAFEWGKVIPYIKKCTFCSDRLADGSVDDSLNGNGLSEGERKSFTASYGTPACAKTCPTGAIQFGDRNALIAEAKKRMADHPGKYNGKIYGEAEVGGTGWMYISSVPFEDLGFPSTEKLGTTAYPTLTDAALGSVPYVVVVGGAVLGGLYWMYQRKLENGADSADSGGES